MTTAALLVLLGALSRLLPHPPNAVPLGALALFSGARLPRRLAFLVPLAAMALSDFFLDFGTGRRAVGLVRVAIYATFAALVFIGRAAATSARAPRLAALSIAGSLFFFSTSNLAVWLSGGLYPRTPAGLALCFVAGLAPWLYPLAQFARYGPFDGQDYGLPRHYFWGAPRSWGWPTPRRPRANSTARPAPSRSA